MANLFALLAVAALFAFADARVFCDGATMGTQGVSTVSSGSEFVIRDCTFTGLFTVGDALLRHVTIIVERTSFSGGFSIDSYLVENVTFTWNNVTVTGERAFATRSVATTTNLSIAMADSIFQAYSTSAQVEVFSWPGSLRSASINVRNVTIHATSFARANAFVLGPLDDVRVHVEDSEVIADGLTAGTPKAVIVLGAERCNITFRNSRVIARAVRHGGQRVAAMEWAGTFSHSTLVIDSASHVEASITSTPAGAQEVLATVLYFGAAIDHAHIRVMNSSLIASSPWLASAIDVIESLSNSTVYVYQTRVAAMAMLESVCTTTRSGLFNNTVTLADVDFVGCATRIWTAASSGLEGNAVSLRCNTRNSASGSAWQTSTFASGQGGTLTIVPCGQCQRTLDCNVAHSRGVSAELSPFHCQCVCNIDDLPEGSERRLWTFNHRCDIVPRLYFPAFSITRSESPSRLSPSSSVSGTSSESASRTVTLVPPTKSETLSRSSSGSRSRSGPSRTRSYYTASESRHRDSKTRVATASVPLPQASLLSSREEIGVEAISNRSGNGSALARSFVVSIHQSTTTEHVRLPSALVTAVKLFAWVEYAGNSSRVSDPSWAAALAKLQAARISMLTNLSFSVTLPPDVFGSTSIAFGMLRGNSNSADQLRLVVDVQLDGTRLVPHARLLPDAINVTIAAPAPRSGAAEAPCESERRASTVLDIVAFAATTLIGVLGRPIPSLVLQRHRFFLYHRYSGGRDSPMYRGPRLFPDAMVLDASISRDGADETVDEYLTAAAVYNTGILLLGYLAAAGVTGVVTLYWLRAGTPPSSADEMAGRTRQRGHALRVAMGKSKTIHACVAVAVIMLQPTLAAGCGLVLSGPDGQSRLLGAIAAISALGPAIVLLGIGPFRLFCAQFVSLRSLGLSTAACLRWVSAPGPIALLLRPLLSRDGVWIDHEASTEAALDVDGEDKAPQGGEVSDSGVGFVACFGVLFEPLTAGRHWYIVVEVALTAAFCLFGALSDRSDVPLIGAIGLLLCGGGGLIACAVLRPFRQTSDVVLLVTSQGLVVLTAIAQVAALADPDDLWARNVTLGFVAATESAAILRALYDTVSVVVDRIYDIDGRLRLAAAVRAADLEESQMITDRRELADGAIEQCDGDDRAADPQDRNPPLDTNETSGIDSALEPLLDDPLAVVPPRGGAHDDDDLL